MSRRAGPAKRDATGEGRIPPTTGVVVLIDLTEAVA